MGNCTTISDQTSIRLPWSCCCKLSSNNNRQPARTVPFRFVLAMATCPGLASINNKSRLSGVLTEGSQQRLAVIEATGVGVAAAMPLLMGENLLKPEWAQDNYLRTFHEEISNGGKEIGGPPLVIHGEFDDRLSPEATNKAVDKTAMNFPSSQLEYVSVPNVTHVPALQAS